MSIIPSRGAGRRWGWALRASAVGRFSEGKMTVRACGGREWCVDESAEFIDI